MASDYVNVRRRQVTAALAGLAAVGAVTPLWAAQPVRIGLTPVFLDDRSGFLGRFRSYLEEALGRPVIFVQKRSYADIVEQLLNGSLTAAWLCGYPFVRYRSSMHLVAVPIYEGNPTYRAYIIAGPTAVTVQDLRELQGRVFAYSDPFSNSGYLYAQDCLRAISARDNLFFRKSFFAFGHQNVITAVSEGLADAGSVDGYVWDSLNALMPDQVSKTRVLTRSEPFGFPPFVCSKKLDRTVRLNLRSAFMEMHRTDAGKQLLNELRLDGFVEGHPSLFDGVAAMMRRVGHNRV